MSEAIFGPFHASYKRNNFILITLNIEPFNSEVFPGEFDFTFIYS